MKNMALSLLMGATLILPTMAMAAPVNTAEVTPADKLAEPVDNTLQAEVEGPDGELLATQPGAVESEEAVAITDAAAMEVATNEATEEENDAMAAAGMQPAQTEQPAPALNMQHSDANYQPLLAGEGATDDEAANTEITLQEKKKDKRGELLATQPADVEFKENRRIAIAR
ncbi:hypothetical protein [Psychrobacter sp. Rd 27.2]|uniref:hypothetical protein n=1 Tax=Psychrobacter sp. Rd 27.2 TaxID=1926479 RepID=UPI000946EF7A|nr:hypothetical protein [Psychrobacter sp. Rd 27.2]OLF40191.1 hypothetical protein BTV99_09755 [Psychrobacter sp. Rd 27.2]